MTTHKFTALSLQLLLCTTNLFFNINAEKNEAAFTFDYPKYKDVKFDPTSNKSALEQALDQEYQGRVNILVNTGFTPIKDVVLETRGGGREVNAFYPDTPEMSQKYCDMLHKSLTTSELLLAQVYRELMTNKQQTFILDTHEHGFWKCTSNEQRTITSCKKLDHEEIKRALESTITKE